VPVNASAGQYLRTPLAGALHGNFKRRRLVNKASPPAIDDELKPTRGGLGRYHGPVVS